MSEINKSLREILLIMAELYKYPNDQLFESLKTGTLEKEVHVLLEKSGFKGPLVLKADAFNSFEQMHETYRRCLVGPKEPFAAPIESVYKKWTTDPNAETLIANETGYIYGDPALHVEHLYKHYNLEIPEHFKKIPDHLSLQLEFLVFLMENSTLEQVHQYVNDHFDWLESLKTQLQLVEDSDFYLAITDQLIQIIDFILKAERLA